MYAQAEENWWGKLYNYVRQAVEHGGYGAAKSIEKLAKSYFSEDRHEEYSAKDEAKTYKKVLIAKYYEANRTKQTNPYREEDVMRDVEAIKTELNAVKELVMREAVPMESPTLHARQIETATLLDGDTLDLNSRHAMPIEAATVLIPKQENFDVGPINSTDENDDLPTDAFEDFQRAARKDTVSLSDHQLTFLLEKVKKAEHDIAKTKRILLLATAVFSVIVGLILLLPK